MIGRAKRLPGGLVALVAILHARRDDLVAAVLEAGLAAARPRTFAGDLTGEARGFLGLLLLAVETPALLEAAVAREVASGAFACASTVAARRIVALWRGVLGESPESSRHELLDACGRVEALVLVRCAQPGLRRVDILALGGSAGGIQPIGALLGGLGARTPATVLVIVHRKPDGAFMLPAVLARLTAMRVAGAHEGDAMLLGSVLVAPPDRHLVVDDDEHLRFVDGPRVNRVRPSIDLLFASAARVFGVRLASVVVSGAGRDGAEGSRAVRERGGRTLALDPGSAQFGPCPPPRSRPGRSSSPRSSSLSCARSATCSPATAAEPRMAASERMVETILERIRETRNFDFRNYKRATLHRRIARRMADRHARTPADYLKLLEKDPHELDTLISSMLIKVTSFFRDRELWDELAQRIIPALLAGKQSGDEVRIWSAGCSTGEEAFSLAILVAEAIGPAFPSYNVKIFGTDVDERAVSAARRGIFKVEQVKSLPSAVLERWFTRTADGYAVKQDLRRLVVFGANNLVSDAPISRLDLLVCRNVFIYLDAALQRRVLSRFHYALAPGGLLVLGKAELIPFAGKMFEQVDLPLRIYRRDGRRAAGTLFPAPEPAARTAPGRGREDNARATGHAAAALEALPGPQIATDLDGVVTVWNAAATRIWGVAREDALGTSLGALGLPGLSTDETLAKAGQVREGKRERITIETVVAPRGQPPVTLAVEILPARDRGDAAIVGVVFSATDVTATRLLETEVRRVNQELKASSGKLQRFIEDLRASNEELETTNEELQSANEELQTTNEELQSTNEEMETTNEELQSANAELDATNRELAHRTQEMHLMSLYQRTIVRSLSAGTLVIDPDGKITSWNLAAERLLGLPESEAIGQTVWTLRIPAIGRALIGKIRRALAERRAFRDEAVAYELPGGGEGRAIVAAVPLLDGERSLGAVILFEDTTRSVALALENVRLKGLLGGVGVERTAAPAVAKRRKSDEAGRTARKPRRS